MHVRNTVESGHYSYHCADWSIPGGVKTGELVHTSQKPRWVGLVKIEVTFYNRTTTPECSEDRTAVPSVVKTESELCVCTHLP